jgi:superfamily I DNA/RNA helicase
MPDILELVVGTDKNLFVGLAGPGTGKSFSFKTIVKSDSFKGKKILVLSFINKLVDDLIVDFKDFANVEVSTLHSFAMQEYSKQTKKVAELDESLDKLITSDYSFIKMGKTDFEKALHAGSLSDEEENFYKTRATYYGNNEQLFSFNSIIYAINQLFSANSDVIPSDYDLILVDEFQDFNQLEWNFIKHLNTKNRIVIVGDDDQSLYGWKSAQPQLIRDLYKDPQTGEFSLDNCYRCTEVIVKSVNDLIKNAKSKGLLKGRLDEKKYLYPSPRSDGKEEVSKKYSKIDFIPTVSGNQLFYQLASRIKKETGGGEKKKRILVLVPSYFKQKMYEGLVKEDLNVVDFELFSDEKHKTLKHKYIIESFRTLEKRKTDNLSVRKIMSFYVDEKSLKTLVETSDSTKKKLWNCLDKTIQGKIEVDVALFKKVRVGKDKLTSTDLKRLNEILNLKNLLSKLINGFDAHTRDAVEVEITTVMGSKGLSADFVYFVGVDDSCVLDYETKTLTDQTICEFLVGITRAKEKLTLLSFKDTNPVVVGLISSHINTISLR